MRQMTGVFPSPTEDLVYVYNGTALGVASVSC
jgi:hypothetical protein